MSYHAYCLHHLKMNLRDKLAGRNKVFRERMVFKFRKCAYAPTLSSFQENINVLINEGGIRVQKFLSDLPVEHWSNAYFKGQRYGEMCSNATESFNSQIRDARHLPVTEMIDMIRVQIMNQMSHRREVCKKWNTFICPDMDS
uniref:Transposase n=1 Tax=Davidia involucrata TaxID=16924 RepID=A0A5B7C5E0_DAVIN